MLYDKTHNKKNKKRQGYWPCVLSTSLRQWPCVFLRKQMAKRFIATDIWEDIWFRKLSWKAKLFWLYICSRCDVAGIWKEDFELASFFIAEPITSDILKEFDGRIEKVDSDKYWIIKFCNFQYGFLSPNASPHKPVISALKRFGLYKRVIKGLQKGCKTLKDQDQDKDKDIRYNINKNTEIQTIKRGEYERGFECLWQEYPKKVGKKVALKHFLASIKTPEDIEKVKIAFQNYLLSKRVKDGFVQDGCRWFNNWQEWVDYKEPDKKMLSSEELLNKIKERAYKKINGTTTPKLNA